MIGKTARIFSNGWKILIASAALASAGEINTGRLVIAMGSCCSLKSAEEHAPVFDVIADTKPDVMLWLGDNWYYHSLDLKEFRGKKNGRLIRGDWSDENAMLARAESVHRHPDLRRILSEVPNFATWDDHDFGYNNCPLGDPEELSKEEQEEIYAGRDAALRVFKKMWTNPGYGTAEWPGTFCSFQRGPVAFFLLDDRYYKDVAQREIWGPAQLDWLKQGLLKAEQNGLPVKIVGNGCQVLPTTKRESFYSEARAELESLLAFIDDNKIKNVFFLSGDRHRSELWLMDRNSRRYYEFTASPFFHNHTRVDPENYPARIWVGHPVTGYGAVTVEIQATGAGWIEFEAFDEHGRTLANLGPTREPDNTPCRSRFELER